MILDPVGPRTVTSVLEDAARVDGDAVLFRLVDGSVVTHAGFLARRDRVAAGLARRGVGAGSVVVIHLPTSVVMIAVLFAVHRLGAVAAMSDPSTTVHEVVRLRQRCGAVITVAEDDADVGTGARVAPSALLEDDGPTPAPVAIGPDTPATILFTSGTTAEPKGVPHRHGHHVHGAGVYVSLLGLAPGSVLMHHFPLFHMNGLNQLGAALLAGAEVLLVERFRSGRFDALLDAFAPTATFLNGTHIKMIRAAGTAPKRPSPLVRVGMALQMADDDYDWFESRYGAVLAEGYGQTETITICLANPVRGARRASCGIPVPGYEVRVVAEGGDDVGELQVRSASRFGLMPGYLDDPEATAAAFDDNWLRTGDVVRVDDGFVVWVDRLKDIIKRAGENISAREVEAVLEAHPAVREVAVVGRPDALREELPVAFVVVDASATPSGAAPTGAATARINAGTDAAADARTDARTNAGTDAGTVAGTDIDELRAFCRTRLAAHKVPVEFVVVESLPRTAVGKIEKKALRARADASDDPRTRANDPRPVTDVGHPRPTGDGDPDDPRPN